MTKSTVKLAKIEPNKPKDKKPNQDNIALQVEE